jgi:hypothetical protein
MKRLGVLAVSLLAFAPVADAAVGFFAYTSLSGGGSVQVARPTGNSIEYGVNYLLEVSPLERPPGCSVELTRAQAVNLGNVYQAAASSPLDVVIDLGDGASVRVIKSPTSYYVESTLDDGTSVTSLSGDCYSDMTTEESWVVGDWLLTAASNKR